MSLVLFAARESFDAGGWRAAVMRIAFYRGDNSRSKRKFPPVVARCSAQ
jgi:hypothetical protein